MRLASQTHSAAKTGAKIGSDLRIRKPIAPVVGTGAVMTPQDVDEDFVTLKMEHRRHVGLNFTSEDLTLDIDSFADQILKPSMARLTAAVEAHCIQMATMLSPWQVGSPGTVPNVLDTYLGARTLLNQALAQKTRGERHAMISSRFSQKIVDALKGLSEDSDQIGKQYREGHMTRAAGFDWAESESTHTHVNGSATVTAAVDATVVTDGTDQLALKSLGNAGVVTAGSVISITGRFDVHPETGAVRTTVKQFVVLSTVTADGTGDAVVTVFPKIYFGATGRKNISAAPTLNDVVTIAGTASVGYECGLAYHKDAFTFATADLVLPSGAEGSRSQYDGFSLRIVKDYDITNDKNPCRIDVMYAFTATEGTHSVRVAG